MIQVELYWILNGEKHPHEESFEVSNATELEKMRAEIAQRHGVANSDVVFKYTQKNL